MDGQTTAAQLAEARKERWHQAENPVLSIEGLREWLSRSGLILYGTRAAQLGAPAPSLVEAAGGDEAAAKSLLARLVAEGGAVPLNLLGAAGGMGSDAPDFVASAGVFSYVFTLRGNKAWKQAPLTSGPVKVSPLALATYEMLASKVTLSSYDLATQLGGGVSEPAVLRALSELWGQLRVIPVAQTDGSATLWELSTARYTKQIKSGANAGQPSALSALISLYLGQAMAATEDEIESFLSPLAARSRVRDVVHALMAARQLETLVIEGKTLLHVAGETPAFAEAPAKAEGEVAAEGEAAADGDAKPRIKKFTARPGSKIGTGLRARSQRSGPGLRLEINLGSPRSPGSVVSLRLAGAIASGGRSSGTIGPVAARTSLGSIGPGRSVRRLRRLLKVARVLREWRRVARSRRALRRGRLSVSLGGIVRRLGRGLLLAGGLLAGDRHSGASRGSVRIGRVPAGPAAGALKGVAKALRVEAMRLVKAVRRGLATRRVRLVMGRARRLASRGRLGASAKGLGINQPLVRAKGVHHGGSSAAETAGRHGGSLGRVKVVRRAVSLAVASGLEALTVRPVVASSGRVRTRRGRVAMRRADRIQGQLQVQARAVARRQSGCSASLTRRAIRSRLAGSHRLGVSLRSGPNLPLATGLRLATGLVGIVRGLRGGPLLAESLRLAGSLRSGRSPHSAASLRLATGQVRAARSRSVRSRAGLPGRAGRLPSLPTARSRFASRGRVSRSLRAAAATGQPNGSGRGANRVWLQKKTTRPRASQRRASHAGRSR